MCERRQPTWALENGQQVGVKRLEHQRPEEGMTAGEGGTCEEGTSCLLAQAGILWKLSHCVTPERL